MSGIDIRPAVESDCEQLSRLCEALWPEANAAEHGREIALILTGKPIATLPLVIFVAANRTGVLTGFIEVGLRSCRWMRSRASRRFCRGMVRSGSLSPERHSVPVVACGGELGQAAGM